MVGGRHRCTSFYTKRHFEVLGGDKCSVKRQKSSRRKKINEYTFHRKFNFQRSLTKGGNYKQKAVEEKKAHGEIYAKVFIIKKFLNCFTAWTRLNVKSPIHSPCITIYSELTVTRRGGHLILKKTIARFPESWLRINYSCTLKFHWSQVQVTACE